MSAVSPKEKNMLLVTAVLALYAVAALCYKKQAQEWKTAGRVYSNAKNKLHEERSLIAASKDWQDKYAQMRGLMPVFQYDRDVDTYWLNIMDSLAERNGLTIARRQADKEVEVGDVYELPIECRDWEGTLESLVRFLYDLQREGAMLDVRQLFIRPTNKPGYLKGTFTLYCAYMRGDVEELPKAAVAGEEDPGNADHKGTPADGAAQEPDVSKPLGEDAQGVKDTDEVVEESEAGEGAENTNRTGVKKNGQG